MARVTVTLFTVTATTVNLLAMTLDQPLANHAAKKSRSPDIGGTDRLADLAKDR